MKTLIAVLTMIFGGVSFVTLAACSTVEGAGEDLEYASEETAEALDGED